LRGADSSFIITIIPDSSTGMYTPFFYNNRGVPCKAAPATHTAAPTAMLAPTPEAPDVDAGA